MKHTILLSGNPNCMEDLNANIAEQEDDGFEVISTQIMSGNAHNYYSSIPTILVTLQK